MVSPRLLIGISAVALLATTAGCATTSSTSTRRPTPFPGAIGTTASAGAHVLAEAVIATARRLRGTPYRLGGTEPGRGFDCSGFVRYVFAQHAIEVPRTVIEQQRLGEPVNRRDVRPGDLIFFSTIAPGASHVAMAVSAEEFIHAPAERGVVRIERTDADYWRARWVTARRIIIEPKP